MNVPRLSFYFWFRLSVYIRSLKNRTTEQHPDSQVILISQQEFHTRICCTLCINITDTCFDHRYSTTVLQTEKKRCSVFVNIYVMRALFCLPVFSIFEFYASNYASVSALGY